MRTLLFLAVLLSVALAQGGSQNGFLDALEELFVPDRGLVERFDSIGDALSQKFPFSVFYALQSPQVQEMNSLDALNGDVGGYFTINMGWLTGVLEAVRVSLAALIVGAISWWVIDRVTPFVRI